MDKIKYALIGCGRIAANHMTAYLNNRESLSLCAVCDIVPEHSAGLLARFLPGESIPAYTDYEQLLQKEKPELIAIATDSGSHAGIALRCIAEGCHLIIEKPIAMSMDDARAIKESAEKKGVKVCACHQNRFNKSIQRIRGALEAGRFGRLYNGSAVIRWNRGPDYYTQAPWRGKWKTDGGALLNQCIHNIDLLRWMMGDEVDEVFAYTDNLCHPYIEAEDLGLAMIKFKNGAYGTVEGTTNIFPKNLEETLYLFGEKGTVKAGGKSVNCIEEWRFDDESDRPEDIIRECAENAPNVYGYGHTRLYADVADAVLHDRAPYVDAAAGMRAVELVLAIYKSAAEHRPIKLPLEHCSSADFCGRFDRGRV